MFQFTLPHGERQDGLTHRLRRVGFNSRSRMGSDPPRQPWRHRRRSFNSRSRMGSDQGYHHDNPVKNVSIHAPAWGATIGAAGQARIAEFQFTLPHGERLS